MLFQSVYGLSKCFFLFNLTGFALFDQNNGGYFLHGIHIFYQAGAGQWGTDEAAFNAVLCARNAAQLRATFAAYKKSFGKDIEEVIDAETSGTLKEGYLAIGQ